MTVMDGANDTVQLSADQVIYFSVCKKMKWSTTGAHDEQRQDPEKILPAVI